MPLADFDIVIGLEVHTQLLTRSKIFCGCSAEFGGAPNTHVCPRCLGMPGVLPSLNAKVVELAVKTGLALGCRVKKKSIWARKNYFYPDLPKGYQVTQFELPICEGGGVPVGDKVVPLVRIHMEEDAGKNVHDPHGGDSLVDLNRAGVPLVEIVSGPDLRSAEEATEYLKSLRAILLYLGVNDGNLEEGSLRCDANVSVKKKGEPKLGQRVELKNMNSFRFLRQAIELEARRQVGVLESGGRVDQETRLYDPEKGETRAMRSKEEAHDYRYFPEPDLPPLLIDDDFVEAIRRTLPELPAARAKRYQEALGLSPYDAAVITADREVADFFDAVVKEHSRDPKKVANWVTGEAARLANETGLAAKDWKVRPAQLAALLGLVETGAVSGTGAKQVFEQMWKTGADPAAVVTDRGLGQISDEGAIEAVVDRVLAASPDEVARYRAGNKKLLGFFVGQVMKEMKGKGNPAGVNAAVKKKLGD
jgi:aspartyl-tRNA(Asn)/glutamyl-tRNA(Gln) amidotransferase subunit B